MTTAPSQARVPLALNVLGVMLPAGMFVAAGGLVFALMAGARIGEAQSGLVIMLSIVLGALIVLTCAVIFWFAGSSIGSWTKNFVPLQGGQAGADAPVTIPLPQAPEVPPEQPAAPASGDTGDQDVDSNKVIPGVGRSTDPSTATKRMDIPYDGETPAAIRYKNPGAQYPSEEAAEFGQLGYGKLKDGNEIARFPHPVNGAAANFELLHRAYAGLHVGNLRGKWVTGRATNIRKVPGYDSSLTVTAEMLRDPSWAIPFMQAMATLEAGRTYPMTVAEWQAAHAMFLAGSADAWLQGAAGNRTTVSLPTGADIVALVRPKIGQKYVFGARAPKDDAGYNGPWDCAELASWAVCQATGKLYGCTNNGDALGQADAYTGAWQRDANSIGRMVSVSEATGTPGAFLLRYPASGATGHIVVSNGQGGTIEAASTTLGVIAGKVEGRRWDTGVLPPGIDYPGASVSVHGPAKIYAVGQPNMDAEMVKAIQTALVAKGFGPLEVDGDYGPATASAAAAFQRAQGTLIADGEVGELTAAALGVAL